MLNFNSVKINELIRFVSKISKVNFVYDESKLQFDVSLVSGKGLSDQELVDALIVILNQNQCSVIERNGTYFIDPSTSPSPADFFKDKEPKKAKSLFQVVKLQFHQGNEILSALKDLCLAKPNLEPKLLQDIQSIQWMKSTNSLLVSCDADNYDEITSLIQTVDAPQKQVFIEVLVVETSLKNGLEFGVDWSMQTKAKSQNNHLQALLNGVDLGVIGDIILHKGLSFLSLGALVSAIEQDKDSHIVLNQKIITQDNQNSKIFVGDTIPFAGSKTEITGSNQQTTSNIEYRDIGVSLSITPLIGEQDIITLDIAEEITEATPNLFASTHGVQGIQTTKTNMVTKAHVPDQHFLILTGMVRNKQVEQKSHIPCLGAIPFIGDLFSHKAKTQEKRHITIFVRPQIVKQVATMKSYTENEMDKVLPKVN
jgi:type III secretion protein C